MTIRGHIGEVKRTGLVYKLVNLGLACLWDKGHAPYEKDKPDCFFNNLFLHAIYHLNLI